MKIIIALLLSLSTLQAYEHHSIGSGIDIEPKILLYRPISVYGMPKEGDKILVPMWIGEEHINYLYIIYDESYYDIIYKIAFWYEVI